MNRVVSLFLILLFALSCNNEEEDAINEIDDDIEPAVTAIGFPIGDPVEQEVGQVAAQFPRLTAVGCYGSKRCSNNKHVIQHTADY